MRRILKTIKPELEKEKKKGTIKKNKSLNSSPKISKEKIIIS